MKKIVFLLITLLFISGCSNIKEQDINEIANEIITANTNRTNTFRIGYKYYIPQGLRIKDKTDYNEVISYKNYKMYLYVDIVSYYNKKDVTYESNLDCYYSEKLENEGKKGYIEINFLESQQYLIEIMYNYAKIEVIVEEDDIKEVISYVLNILNSIEYNDSIISNILEEDILSFTEEEYDIFSTTSSESKYLYYLEEYDNYKEEDNTIKDSDLVN